MGMRDWLYYTAYFAYVREQPIRRLIRSSQQIALPQAYRKKETG